MKAPPVGPRPLTFSLLRLLADGEFHSGETMARQLQVSRAGVNNALQGLEHYGLTLYRIRGRGYCLANPLQWLEAGLIGGHLGRQRKDFHVEILDSTPSSNTLLLQRAAEGAPSGSVVAVEWQSAGRGRMGRTWHSSLGSALTFSLLWRFDLGLAGLSGLSLAAGVALIRGLRSLGVGNARLKWPNDVLDARGAKLAGILIEAQGDMLGPSAVVIGVGLNLSLPRHALRQIGQPATSLTDMHGMTPDRNQLLAVLLGELGGILRDFAAQGFGAWRAEWEACHAYQGQRVCLVLPSEQATGIARGVTDKGALKLETEQGMRIFQTGEISLRGDAGHAAA
jgi:BirA family biotin operon repressor/biotin-[acetyl-CoA-carboxylase] ligase